MADQVMCAEQVSYELARHVPRIALDWIAEHPEDPYFHELKGQILFENGRIAESIGPYREAMRYRLGALGVGNE